MQKRRADALADAICKSSASNEQYFNTVERFVGADGDAFLESSQAYGLKAHWVMRTKSTWKGSKKDQIPDPIMSRLK